MARGAGIGAKRREQALDLWAREPFAGADAIADSLGIGGGTLHTLVRRARADGDVRAVSRPISFRRGGSWTRFFLRLRAEGRGVEEMAKLSLRTPREVKAILRTFDRRAAA